MEKITIATAAGAPLVTGLCFPDSVWFKLACLAVITWALVTVTHTLIACLRSNREEEKKRLRRQGVSRGGTAD